MKTKYVVYHAASTMEKKTYKSAHAAFNLVKKLNAAYGEGTYAFAPASVYVGNVVKMVERTNLMSGEKFMEASNTPGYMSAASEAYWSM